MFPLFFLFVALPIAEVMLIINVSASIGGWNTFFIVLITAFFGAYFVRQQGFALIKQIQTKIQTGVAPSTEMAEGLLLLLAGVLLITPGFITDMLGFLFTLPFSRGPIAKFLITKVVVQHAGKQQAGFNHTTGPQNDPDYNSRSSNRFSEGDTIDGEYTDKTKNDDKNRLN